MSGDAIKTAGIEGWCGADVVLILVGHCRLVHNKFVHWGAMLPCMPLALAVALLVQMGGFPGPKFYTSPVSQKPFTCRPTFAAFGVCGCPCSRGAVARLCGGVPNA